MTNPTSRAASGPRLMLVLAAIALGACVYRPPIQQGNLIDQENLDQVEIGMTRNQIRFLLGSPLVDDPFHADRWDYLYYVRQGRSELAERHWITVYFDGNEVSRIERGVDSTTPEPVDNTPRG